MYRWTSLFADSLFAVSLICDCIFAPKPQYSRTFSSLTSHIRDFFNKKAKKILKLNAEICQFTLIKKFGPLQTVLIKIFYQIFSFWFKFITNFWKMCIDINKKTQHVDEIDFFVIYLEPIFHFLVIVGLSIRGFGILTASTANNEVRLYFS